jgi:hypothetical protein
MCCLHTHKSSLYIDLEPDEVNIWNPSHSTDKAVSCWNLRYSLELVYTNVIGVIDVSVFAQETSEH